MKYKSIRYYFKHFFKDADICVLSSHAHGSASEIAEMIQELKQRCYNVAGVFWSNGFDDDARQIAMLPWTELLWVENPIVRDRERMAVQLDEIARHFSELLIARAVIQ